jgi:hypothetical protein
VCVRLEGLKARIRPYEVTAGSRLSSGKFFRACGSLPSRALSSRRSSARAARFPRDRQGSRSGAWRCTASPPRPGSAPFMSSEDRNPLRPRLFGGAAGGSTCHGDQRAGYSRSPGRARPSTSLVRSRPRENVRRACAIRAYEARRRAERRRRELPSPRSCNGALGSDEGGWRCAAPKTTGCRMSMFFPDRRVDRPPASARRRARVEGAPELTAAHLIPRRRRSAAGETATRFVLDGPVLAPGHPMRRRRDCLWVPVAAPTETVAMARSRSRSNPGTHHFVV